VVTLHVPLTYSGQDATWHLLGAEELALLPAGALVIQTSRGGVLDEAAAEELLPAKGAFLAVDVWEREPLINGRLLERALLATPHIAGHTWQARVACSCQLLEQFARWAGLTVDTTPCERALADCPPPPPELPWEDPHRLLALLRERRRLEDDTRTVRSWQNLSESEQAQAFRAFRASYPRRPETLSLPGEPSVPL
jgi:erythronate-4-phosphate dehydrogenase